MIWGCGADLTKSRVHYLGYSLILLDEKTGDKRVFCTDGSIRDSIPSSSGSSSSSKRSEPSPETKIANAVENAVDRQIDSIVSAAVASGADPEAAKANSVVRLSGKWLGTNMFGVGTMKKFDEANVDIEFSYDYEGNHYVITIPAGGALVDETIPWYGPLYLASKFPAVITPIEEE